MSSSIKRGAGRGVGEGETSAERNGWDITRGQVIRGKRGEVEGEVKTRGECEKQTERSRDSPSSS